MAHARLLEDAVIEAFEPGDEALGLAFGVAALDVVAAEVALEQRLRAIPRPPA